MGPASLAHLWPLFGLELRTPRLFLRVIRDEDLSPMVEAAASGIHPPERNPFTFPWTSVPGDQLPTNTAVHVWRTRAETGPDQWTIPLGVWLDGAFVGVQDLRAARFTAVRSVTTGSWLRRSAQGRGVGREMRAAGLVYAFDYLGATEATSEAASWNAASLGVSHSLGYTENGSRRELWGDAVEDVTYVRITPQALRRPPWTLHVAGHDAVARFLGLGAP
ncbi:GNAT family N-acetyltransferase [Zhihengliuella flava]|uniref:RimJ/RimL family protein N-acetyltransferase n=1 Tax=Zhihengliuella flava TaxID=1285193 RepID=A0A931GE14_9MICC|nr:GNAT family protein [Zhihengliuella flava]MBG6083988.1 RimJ/RimL family protein N-acetyltransferase [Zhihengliuella flava]